MYCVNIHEIVFILQKTVQIISIVKLISDLFIIFESISLLTTY
jgi:hypothetical protein